MYHSLCAHLACCIEVVCFKQNKRRREFLTLDLGHANNLPFAESGLLCKLLQHLVWPLNALVLQMSDDQAQNALIVAKLRSRGELCVTRFDFHEVAVGRLGQRLRLATVWS